MPEESPASELPTRSPDSRGRWLIPLVLFSPVLLMGYFLRSPTQEGQWLAGDWKHVETDGESRFEYEWTFESNGRFLRTNHVTLMGERPSKSIQKFTGHWFVHDGKLFVRIDRSMRRSLAVYSRQAYLAVQNAVTGSNQKLIDVESSEGTLVQSSQDCFTVTFIDPAAPDKAQTPQTWSRVP